MHITRTNPISGKIITRDIKVTLNQLQAWKSGTPIQKALSNLSASDREFIKTGLTDEDWDNIFAEDPINTLQDTLDHLTEWFLAGSRCMAKKDSRITIKKDTDFDIIAPMNQHNLNFIIDQADWYTVKPEPVVTSFFSSQKQVDSISEYHFDETTQVIGKFYDVVIEGKQHEVQITLRTEFDMVRSIWANISSDFYYYSLWKRGPVLKNNDDYREIIRTNLNQLYAIYRNNNGLSGMVM